MVTVGFSLCLGKIKAELKPLTMLAWMSGQTLIPVMDLGYQAPGPLLQYLWAPVGFASKLCAGNVVVSLCQVADLAELSLRLQC